jgi:hypothetical protein
MTALPQLTSNFLCVSFWVLGQVRGLSEAKVTLKAGSVILSVFKLVTFFSGTNKSCGLRKRWVEQRLLTGGSTGEQYVLCLFRARTAVDPQICRGHNKHCQND